MASAISGKGSLTVRGAGEFEFSGKHTYEGGTFIHDAVLRIVGELGMGDLTLSDGAKIQQIEGTNTIGSLTLKTDSSLQLSNGTLAFGDSSATQWTPGCKLTITGEIRPEVLRFGEIANALTSAQLRQISCNNRPVKLTQNGYLEYINGTIMILR